MTSPFHPGERAVQARAGVLGAATRVGGIIDAALPPHARSFLAAQEFAVVGSADDRGRVWASLVSGAPGMLRAVDPRTLHIASAPAAGDPLRAALAGARALATPTTLGVLVIDLATRRRLRVNGTAAPAPEGGVLVRIREAYWICPKYIQARTPAMRVDRAGAPAADGGEPQRASTLTDAQRAWLARADTFFIASAHRDAGADASHRGGAPGFVQLARGAAGEDVVTFPDYPGNNMFNTFGNLAVDPTAGLLFLDFERGVTLQLTGTAEVLWSAAEVAAFPGAERAVRFRVAEAIELPHATPLRWRLRERSPFNPPPPRAAG